MSTEDIFPGRKYSAKDLELYFDFVNDTDLSPTAPTLETLKKYKQQFEQYHANCEIILYGDHPLHPPESETYHFLGIDIVNDGESFLENPNWNPLRSPRVTEFGWAMQHLGRCQKSATNPLRSRSMPIDALLGIFVLPRPDVCFN